MKNFYISSFFSFSTGGSGSSEITIYFDTQEGSSIEPKTYSIGKPYGSLPTPTREGYKFVGWYDNNSGGNLITEETRATATILTLYARWEIEQYTVRFLDWDDSELKNEKVNYGGTATPPVNPSRTGYTFSKWNKDFNNIVSDVDIKALYNINSYTLTFDPNGGEVTPTSKEVVYNEKYGSLPTPTKENKEFLGWFTQQNDGVKVDENTIIGASSVTIYAHWKDIIGTVKITLKSSSGSVLDTLTKEGIVGNSESVVFDEKTGYTKPSNMDITYKIEEQNLEAIYTLINYNITYNLDGGVADNPSTYNIESENITLNNPSKEGASFIGWTGTGLSENTLEVIIPKGSTENREYTANYNNSEELNKVVIT